MRIQPIVNDDGPIPVLHLDEKEETPLHSSTSTKDADQNSMIGRSTNAKVIEPYNASLIVTLAYGRVSAQTANEKLSDSVVKTLEANATITLHN